MVTNIADKKCEDKHFYTYRIFNTESKYVDVVYKNNRLRLTSSHGKPINRNIFVKRAFDAMTFLQNDWVEVEYHTYDGKIKTSVASISKSMYNNFNGTCILFANKYITMIIPETNIISLRVVSGLGCAIDSFDDLKIGTEYYITESQNPGKYLSKVCWLTDICDDCCYFRTYDQMNDKHSIRDNHTFQITREEFNKKQYRFSRVVQKEY
jgi:hypothetical protein